MGFTFFDLDLTTEAISKKSLFQIIKLLVGNSTLSLPQEIAYVERVQGTLKNNYIVFENLKETNMTYVSSKIVRLYNDERPYLGLHRMTLTAFEMYVDKLTPLDRSVMSVYQ